MRLCMTARASGGVSLSVWESKRRKGVQDCDNVEL